jgi:general transcription factor 3C polypeptide 5 (transcription factor C subunit 1)
MSKPMMSHNVATRNVVLHITVPKRTGRRRKKGSNGPFLDPAEVNDHLSKGSKHSTASGSPRARLDDRTKHLLRALQDNKDNYDAKPVGVIEHTHRFRGKSATHVYMSTSQRRMTGH